MKHIFTVLSLIILTLLILFLLDSSTFPIDEKVPDENNSINKKTNFSTTEVIDESTRAISRASKSESENSEKLTNTLKNNAISDNTDDFSSSPEKQDDDLINSNTKHKKTSQVNIYDYSLSNKLSILDNKHNFNKKSNLSFIERLGDNYWDAYFDIALNGTNSSNQQSFEKLLTEKFPYAFEVASICNNEKCMAIFRIDYELKLDSACAELGNISANCHEFSATRSYFLEDNKVIEQQWILQYSDSNILVKGELEPFILKELTSTYSALEAESILHEYVMEKLNELYSSGESNPYISQIKCDTSLDCFVELDNAIQQWTDSTGMLTTQYLVSLSKYCKTIDSEEDGDGYFPVSYRCAL